MAGDTTRERRNTTLGTSPNGTRPGESALRTRAFGLDIHSDFPMPGVGALDHRHDGRELRLRRAGLDAVKGDFPEPADRIAELRFDDDSLAVSLDAAGERGYLAYAFDFGHARVSADGREALIARFDEPDWVWQRYLTGQLLPLAALLQGLEVFHSCVLGLDGQAVAVVAHSGVGKTTLALQLALQGVDFMSDDVLVLEPTGNGVRAHPGIGLANVRPDSRHLLPALERSGLAKAIGERERETRIAVRRSDDALPLGALFVLTRFVEPRPLELERLAPVDPRVLLASSFNFSVRTPERLVRQLDVCARVDRTAAVFRVSCGGDVDSAAVAEAILERSRAALGC